MPVLYTLPDNYLIMLLFHIGPPLRILDYLTLKSSLYVLIKTPSVFIKINSLFLGIQHLGIRLYCELFHYAQSYPLLLALFQ